MTRSSIAWELHKKVKHKNRTDDKRESSQERPRSKEFSKCKYEGLLQRNFSSHFVHHQSEFIQTYNLDWIIKKVLPLAVQAAKRTQILVQTTITAPFPIEPMIMPTEGPGSTIVLFHNDSTKLFEYIYK